MSEMDKGKQEGACILDQTTTVIFESAVTARRRRMEIRRFKRVSGPSATIRSLSSVQQGNFGNFKRTRPARASSICSICYTSNDSEGDLDMFSNARALDEQNVSFSANIVGEFKVPGSHDESDDLIRTGLIRSKSFPQCVHAGRCVLQIRKTSRNHGVADIGGHFPALVSKDGGSSMADEPSGLSVLSPTASSDSASDAMKEILSADLAVDKKVTAFKSDTDAFDDVTQKGNLSSQGSSSRNLESSFHAPDPGNVSPPGQADESTSKVLTSSSALFERQLLSRCPLSGKVLVCGRRREMEDTAVIAPYFTQIPYERASHDAERACDLHFFGVYDGHAGAQASKFCAERLHHALTEELWGSQVAEDMRDDSEWEKVMTSCFLKVDREVGGICPTGRCDSSIDSSGACCINAVAPDNVGTTAVVAVVSSSRIVIANCGDSRAVLSRGGVAIPLSKDHKPEKEDETCRIEAAGGRVIYWDGFRVAGLLALSRAIGDRYLKKYVISEPDVLCMPRASEDECLILASDGLWDVISNDTACDVARRCLASARRRHEHRVSVAGEDSACAQVAALLVKLAYGRGSRDNISVVVIDLKSRPL